jgi:hypothetical protein
LDSRLKSYGVFKIWAQVWACSQPLWMQENLPKTAKICPNMKLWNLDKNRDFSVFQKYKFLSLEHVSTIWIFNPRICHMLFLLSKTSLCMWISAYPSGSCSIWESISKFQFKGKLNFNLYWPLKDIGVFMLHNNLLSKQGWNLLYFLISWWIQL